jgi:hypothetical protein
MCPKKKRFAEKDNIGSRLGFRVFQRFFALTTNSKKEKTFDDFIDSRYYVSFVKFGRHLVQLNPINTNDFVDFVIRNGVKLNDWQKDYVYETYLQDLVSKEPPEKGLERTIVFMNEWADENNCTYDQFFSVIPTTEAAYLIKTGRISPWVLYLSESAGNLLDQFNDEQYNMIKAIIDPSVWTKRIQKHSEDVKFIKETLKVAGI